VRPAFATLLLILLSACAGPMPVAPEGAALTPDERDAYSTALRALIEGEPDAALAGVMPLTRREPWYVPAHVLYQDALTAQGHRAAAVRWYAAEAEIGATDAARVLLAGRLAPRDERRREAAYRRAAELDPDSPWPALALAYELTRSAREDATRTVTEADRGYLAEAAAAEERARAEHAEAQEIASRLLASHPQMAEVHAAAAEVALTYGLAAGDRERIEAARGYAETAAALDPGRPRWLVLAARVHRELIDDQSAAKALEQALQLAPDDPGLHASLGRVLLDLGRAEEARDALATARAGRPDDAAIATDLGVAYHRTGQLEESVEELERAARLAPADPRPIEALALVHLDAGDLGRAADAAREYLRRGGPDRAGAERILRQLGRAELPPPR
jgi:Flp pilus assembly protein TadD